MRCNHCPSKALWLLLAYSDDMEFKRLLQIVQFFLAELISGRLKDKPRCLYEFCEDIDETLFNCDLYNGNSNMFQTSYATIAEENFNTQELVSSKQFQIFCNLLLSTQKKIVQYAQKNPADENFRN